MDIIKTFILNETTHVISILREDDDYLFRADQIGRVLGIKDVHTSTKNMLDDVEKVRRSVPTPGGTQSVTYLTEQGVYKVLFTSRKECAVVFRTWVCSVLKSISATGKYEYEQHVKQLQAENDTLVDTQAQKEALLLQSMKDELAQTHHKNLMTAHDHMSVLYIGLIRKKEEKNLIKIGWSNDIAGRVQGLRRDYGSMTFLSVFPCNKNLDFEAFMHAHENIKRYKYLQRDVRLDGKAEKDHKEIFLMTDEQLKTTITIATRNVKDYRTREMSDAQIESMSDSINSIKQSLDQSASKRERETTTDDVVLQPLKKAANESNRGFCSKGLIGSKIQQYTADGFLVKTHSQMSDVLRISELSDMCESSVRNAITDAKTYRGFRWMYLERAKPDDTVQALAECMDGERMNVGWVAQMSLDSTVVHQVQPSSKHMAKLLGKRDQSRFNKALKANQPYEDYVYMMWCDVAKVVKDSFKGKLPVVEARGNANSVNQVDPSTGGVVKVWEAQHQIQTQMAVSAKTLRKHMASQVPLKGFKWQRVGK